MTLESKYMNFSFLLIVIGAFGFIDFYIALIPIFLLPAIYSMTNNLEEDKKKKRWGVVTYKLESRNNLLSVLLLIFTFIYIHVVYNNSQMFRNNEKATLYCEKFEESGIDCSRVWEILNENTFLLVD